jgi:endo-1,4-beta-xylanase
MNSLTRREALAAGLAFAAAGCTSLSQDPQGPAGTSPVSLNGLAKEKGLAFGSCLGGGRDSYSFRDSQVRALMIEQCGILVPENELKWVALRPDARTFDFARADALIAFGEAHGMRIRGHTLLWHNMKWFPDWLQTYDFGTRPASEAERLLREHITTVCAHYGTRIFTYDVVNETIDAETGEMRDTVLTRYLGPKVIDIAFDTARQAAPHARLVYNDYMSWGPGNQTHRDGVLRLLERLKASGAPVDTLGVQSHIGPGASNSTPQYGASEDKGWRHFLDAATAMGLDLAITEFDVGDQALPADIAVRDKMVAEMARPYLDTMMSYSQFRYVMAWGLVDKYSWLRQRWPRADGLPKRPSPYDDGYQPKLLRDAIANAFRTAPARPAGI